LTGFTTLPIDTRVTLLQGDTILKKYAAYLPTVVLLLSAIANTATPAIAAFWASHASAAAIFAPLAVIVAHWLPSPYAGADSKTDQETTKP
jgi:cobalamin synthase